MLPKRPLPTFLGLVILLSAPVGAQFDVRAVHAGTLGAFQPIDLVGVDSKVTMEISEWKQWVHDNNRAVMADLAVIPVGQIDVRAGRERDRGAAVTEYVQVARRMAADMGANKLYMDETVVEEETGRVVSISFKAYRITYKRLLVSPAFIAALPYNPLPDYYLEAQLADWNAKHPGRVAATFVQQPGRADRKAVLSFVKNLKDGTPISIALRDGSSVLGRFEGFDENGIWVRPSGVRGIFLDRALRPSQVESIGVLN